MSKSETFGKIIIKKIESSGFKKKDERWKDRQEKHYHWSIKNTKAHNASIMANKKGLGGNLKKILLYIKRR